MAEICFQSKLCCNTGVHPRRLQVRTTLGRSDRPDSSMKTIVRPSLLVALGSALFRLLAGKAQPAQQMPQVPAAVLHAEALRNQLADVRQRPKLRGISAAQSSGHQQFAQLALLFAVQIMPTKNA